MCSCPIIYEQKQRRYEVDEEQYRPYPGCWAMEGEGRRFDCKTRGRSAEQRGLDTTETLTLNLKVQGSPKLRYLICPDHECDYKRGFLPHLEAQLERRR